MTLKSSTWHTLNPCPVCGCPMEDWSSEREYDYRCRECGVVVHNYFENAMPGTKTGTKMSIILKVLSYLFYIFIIIVVLLFFGWITWNEVMCTGTLGNNMCSDTYWYMLGLK